MALLHKARCGMWSEMEKVVRGEHAALFYRTRTEQLAAVVPYLAIGLQRDERCLYIAEENSVGLILKHLRDAGVDVGAALDRRALRVTTKSETYLRHGAFDPERMVKELRHEVAQAQAAGFAGFRGSGEMSWALALSSSLPLLTSYELALHREYPAGFVALCQFNEASFPPRIISEMIRWHSSIVARGRLLENSFYDPQISDSSGEAGATLISVEDVVRGRAG
jgi:hypothetical protein